MAVGVNPLIDQLRDTEPHVTIDSTIAPILMSYLRERGGIYVLDDLEITTYPKPRQFLPRRNKEGEDNLGKKPHWSYGFTYLLTDPKFFLVDCAEELLRVPAEDAKPRNRTWREGKIKTLLKQHPEVRQEIYCYSDGDSVVFAHTKDQIPLATWWEKHGVSTAGVPG